MSESEDEWIRKRAYALWEQEGYPTGKDREHWEQAKLEYATQAPTASVKAAAKPKKTATEPKAPKAAAAKAEKAPAKAPKAAAKPAAAKAASSKAVSKAPAAMPAAVEPTKKRSKKVPAGE
jgi:hypothetical protein